LLLPLSLQQVKRLVGITRVDPYETSRLVIINNKFLNSIGGVFTFHVYLVEIFIFWHLEGTLRVVTPNCVLGDSDGFTKGVMRHVSGLLDHMAFVVYIHLDLDRIFIRPFRALFFPQLDVSIRIL
jgi:hypothetical protein